MYVNIYIYIYIHIYIYKCDVSTVGRLVNHFVYLKGMTSMGLVLKSWPRTAAQVLMGAAACRLVMLDHPQAQMSKELIHLPIAIQYTEVL